MGRRRRPPHPAEVATIPASAEASRDEFVRDWKNVPPHERPKYFCAPCYAGFFHEWKTAKWYWLSLVVIAGSAIAVFQNHGIFESVVSILLGGLTAAHAFGACCSGIVSSRRATYFRETEPVPYWCCVTVSCWMYFFVASLGYWSLFL